MNIVLNSNIIQTQNNLQAGEVLMEDGLKYYLILRKDKLRASFAGSGQKAEMMKETLALHGYTVQEVSKKEFLEKRDAM